MKDETLTSNELWFIKAQEPDSNRIWEIILQAKAQMKRLGSHQWDDNYPTSELIAEDIRSERGYVLRNNESIVAYGVISFEAEPAYAEIRGKWQNEQPYVIVHRLSVAEEVKHQGIARRFMQEAEKMSFAKGIDNFRIDTNYDNHYMLRLIDSLGFAYSGEVIYRENKVRRAFEKTIII